MRVLFSIFMLALGCSCASIHVGEDARDGVVKRVQIEGGVLSSILDDYRERLPIGIGRGILAVRVERRDTPRILVTAPDREGFLWYQTYGADAPIGYMKEGQVEIVIFGDEMASLFKVTDEQVRLEYLQRLDADELDYLPSWDPYTHIYHLTEDGFEFDKVMACSVFPTDGC